MRKPTDWGMNFGMAFWFGIACTIAYAFGNEAIHDHWSIPRWLAGIAVLAFLVGPLLVMACVYWFKRDD